MTQLTTQPQNDLRFAQAQPLQRRGRAAQLVRAVFNPPFLQRIDRQLMLNSPWLWATKLHRVAWLSGLLLLLSLTLTLMIPTGQPNMIPGLFKTSIFVIAALQTLLLVYWLQGSDHHHAERTFGSLRDRTGWAEFASSIIALLLIGSSLLLYFGLSRARIQQLGASTIASEALILMGANKDYYQHDEWFKVPISQLANDLTSHAGSVWLASKYNDFPTWPSSAEKAFVESALDRDMLRSYGQHIAHDPSVLFTLLSRYSGSSVTEIAAAYDSYITGTSHSQEKAFNQIARKAQMSSYFLTRVGFAQHDMPHFRLTLLILLTIAIHGALLRFIYHNAGGRGFIYTVLSLGALAMSFYPVVLVLGLGYLILNWITNAIFGSNLISNSLWDELAITVAMAVLFTFIYLIYRGAASISKLRQFARPQAVMLYILPFLLISIPYILLLAINVYFEVHNGYGWFEYRFFDNYYATVGWSLAPLGWWILYAAQFAYLPIIPFLKKQYTRLNALPIRN